MKIKVLKDVFKANETMVHDIRKLLDDKRVRLINIIGAPGCGKTSLIEKIAGSLKGKYSVGVIEGDIETTIDAERLAGQSIPVVQINTSAFGGACHLEAASIRQALNELDLQGLDLVFVENVGNLVCPAEFNIGEDAKVAVLSMAEGADKPAKYPLLFTKAKVLWLNKIDLAPYTDFDNRVFKRNLEQTNPGLHVLRVSARTGEGIPHLAAWIEDFLSSN